MNARRRVWLLGLVALVLAASIGSVEAVAQGTVDGPNIPSTVASTTGPFVKPWTSPGNASAPDGADATATVTAPLQQSDFLDATGYGFSIPSDRVIRRIEVRIKGRANTQFSFVTAQLLKGGAPAGAPMTAAYPGTASDGTVVFNDQGVVEFEVPLTLWNTTWTPAQINDADFGVRLYFETLSGSIVTFEVDSVRVWVYSFPTLPAVNPWGLIAVLAGVATLGAFALRRRRVIT